MATVKCEYCDFEQDLEKSRICDQCGKRISRAPDNFAAPAPAKAAKKVEAESMRCPNCGHQSTADVCSNCGAKIRARGL